MLFRVLLIKERFLNKKKMENWTKMRETWGKEVSESKGNELQLGYLESLLPFYG